MASQSLYRKWRSQTFNEMVGQEEIRRTLKNALTSNTLCHAYLFTGPRGTGKTSTARLLAKTVNCANPQDGEPCNECQQCREITAGNSFNVIEIDAASNRGIDSIRELREKVMVPPSTGKYKIYILDEAHMLTTEAFNALLKTLEEPPDYAIFVMATTDVHKMLPTVISRCQRLDFKRISTRQIVSHLLFVAKEEAVELDRGAAELIARTAAGGMRDALSLLDQAIAYAGNAISLAQVQLMLGVADPRAISKLIAHIAGLESPALLYLIHDLSEAGADLRQINAQLVEYWRALMLAKAGADVAMILDLTEDEVKEVQQLLPAFTLEELTECARIFAQNELMQKNQATPQLGLELASLECIELHRRVQAGQPAIQQNHATPDPIQVSIQPPVAHSAPRPTATTNNTQPVQQNPTQRPARREEPPVEMSTPARNENPTQATNTPPVPATPAHAALTVQQIIAGWENVKKRTSQKNQLLATFIGMCDVLGVESDGENAVIVIRAAKAAHHKFIRDNDRPKEVEWALSIEFGVPCKLRVLPPDQLYTTGTPPQGSTSYSFGSVATQPSAYRERPQPVQPPQPTDTTRPPSVLDLPSNHTSTISEKPEAYMSSSLARQQGVGENKRVKLSKEEAQQKVQQDPVVREVVRMFGATIADIQLK
ncbi:MAG TPA: DNA polymerase III subunit gamma/tau [Ktedonobacteraceae bacterium]|nr:DNA polymerase III subunit gamma/tau [Ktedonobacteraceae bacterium]